MATEEDPTRRAPSFNRSNQSMTARATSAPTRLALAVVLLLVGSGLLFATVVAILDPVGTKLSDDADPFGSTSDLWKVNLSYTLVSVSMIVAGIGLLRSVPSGTQHEKSDESQSAG
jgi:hypothetical protein